MDDTVSTLTRVVRQAGIIVAEADLPDSLRPYAFERTLDLLLAEAALVGPRAPVVRPATSAAPQDAVASGADAPANPLLRIAQRAGLDEAAVREVYRLEHDQVSLVVGDKKLDRNKATGSRQVTLLVAGGRQAAGFEEWTNLAWAREVCSLYNRLDSKNYAATIKSMADVFNFHGQGVHREVRLTMPGWDEWAVLVRRLVAGADHGGR